MHTGAGFFWPFSRRRVHDWLYEGYEAPAGPAARPVHTDSWWKVMSWHLPHAYFGWTEGNPITYVLKFLAFGEGDTAPVTRDVLRKSEPDPLRRPRVHVG